MINYLDRIKGRRVLVTGGLGFIGHNLVKALVHDFNCQVTVVDDCSNSRPDVLDVYAKAGEIDFQRISVLDPKKFLPLIDDQNYVFHLACVQISASGKNAMLDLQVNAESTLKILEYIRDHPPKNLERFIYTSSCSIYGSSLELPVNENSKPSILSHYAATKYLGEAYTSLYNTKYDLPTAIVRYSNIYGYGQSPRNPYCGVLGHFIHNALLGKPLVVYGDGEQTRDYTFITDAIHATLLAAVHPKAFGEIFNIGTSVETSVNRLADLIAQHVPNVVVENHADRDIDNIRRRWINIEHIHRKLGWVPKIGIAKGIEKTISWYRETTNLGDTVGRPAP